MVSCTVFHGKEGQHVVVRQCDNVLVIPAVMHRTPVFWHLSTAAQQKICARLNSPANRFKTHTKKKQVSLYSFHQNHLTNQTHDTDSFSLHNVRFCFLTRSVTQAERPWTQACCPSFTAEWRQHICAVISQACLESLTTSLQDVGCMQGT